MKGYSDDDISSGIIHDGSNGCIGGYSASGRE